MKVINRISELPAAKKQAVTFAFLSLLLTVVFVLSFKIIFKIDYENNNGLHNWLSGSTLKFVNNWLAETPQKLHFVNFEAPDSIEFNSLSERGPYVSYPTGVTFFVYFFAKLTGHKSIDLSFLKHFQGVCFWLEVLLLAFFVFRFLSRTGVKSEKERFFITFFTALFWMWLPTTAWYLTNIYFADQCVILFVTAFLLVEYESMNCRDRSLAVLLNIMKFYLIFAGMMVDYYFWILAFVAFVCYLIFAIKEKKTILNILANSLLYVVPVALALGAFAAQLFSVPNWQDALKNRFLFRAGMSESRFNTYDYLVDNLIDNFKFAFGLEGCARMLPMIALAVFACFRHAGLKPTGAKFRTVLAKSVFGKNGMVFLVGFIAPLLQVALLRSHSAVHEFSMIKFGWCFAVLPIIVSAVLCRMFDFEEKKISKFSFFFTVCFLSMLVLTSVPFSSYDFYNSRKSQFNIDFDVAKILREKTSYEHVCFSFSHEIPNNPPQELGASGKRVHKIRNINEMNTRFRSLKEGAKKILVIDKSRSSKLPKDQKKAESDFKHSHKIIYEDKSVCLVSSEGKNEN